MGEPQPYLNTEAPQLFSHRRYRLQKCRFLKVFPQHSFLHQTVETNLLDRLNDIKRDFKSILIIGGRSSHLKDRFPEAERLVQLDGFDSPHCGVVFDNEAYPFRSQSFDLVLSLLTLHWTNDLPGALLQLRQCLKPDGLFLGALFGGETLTELSQALLMAEASTQNTASRRIAPMVGHSMLGSLLQRAGFALPVTDIDRLTVQYPDVRALMKDLRGMGESNKLIEEGGPLSRSLLNKAQEIYTEKFSDGPHLKASFNVLYATGWAPAPQHPKALFSRLRNPFFNPYFGTIIETSAEQAFRSSSSSSHRHQKLRCLLFVIQDRVNGFN